MYFYNFRLLSGERGSTGWQEWSSFREAMRAWGLPVERQADSRCWMLPPRDGAGLPAGCQSSPRPIAASTSALGSPAPPLPSDYSVNKIRSLEDFQHCRNLVELFVRKNEIADLSQILYLQSLPKLRNLWLEENPCANEDE